MRFFSIEHLKRFMPWAKETQTYEESYAVIERSMQAYRNCEDFMLGIFSSDGMSQWGGTGFHLREGPLAMRSAEMGMWVRADLAFQGLGTQFLTSMLRWGFDVWGWERLTWRCDVENIPSARLALKVGFQQEGRLCGHRRHQDGSRTDTLCFGLLAQEKRL
jgi:ribosomal-protein-serine acetyltransferase